MEAVRSRFLMGLVVVTVFFIVARSVPALTHQDDVDPIRAPASLSR